MALDFGLVTHPSLGCPPLDPTAGYPAAADLLRRQRDGLAARALETLAADDPSLRERHDEIALRRLLRDIGTILEQLATAVATGEPAPFAAWCNSTVPLFRRRGVPMDDLVRLLDVLDRVIAAAVPPESAASASNALAAAADRYRAHRRLGGDARKRNPIAAFIYKGA